MATELRLIGKNWVLVSRVPLEAESWRQRHVCEEGGEEDAVERIHTALHLLEVLEAVAHLRPTGKGYRP